MQGDRTNYGRGRDCLRITLRMYGATKKYVERRAKELGVTAGDVVSMAISRTANRAEAKGRKK